MTATIARMSRRQFFARVGQSSLVLGFSLSPIAAALLTGDARAASLDSELTVDSWLAAVPGYQEVKEFQRKLGGKLGYALAIGMTALSSFPEVGRELSKQEGAPVQVTVKISGPRGPAESTMEQGSFSSGPVEVAKFEVPAGFKKIDPK